MDEREKERFKATTERELLRAKKGAFRELSKVEREFHATLGTVERYMKKNPRQATLVTFSLGAVLGTLGALFLKQQKRKRGKQ